MQAWVCILTLIVFVLGFCIAVLGIDEHDKYVLSFGAALVIGAAIVLVIH